MLIFSVSVPWEEHPRRGGLGKGQGHGGREEDLEDPAKQVMPSQDEAWEEKHSRTTQSAHLSILNIVPIDDKRNREIYEKQF